MEWIAAKRASALPDLIGESATHPGGADFDRPGYLLGHAPCGILEDELVITVVLSAVHSGTPLLRALDAAGRNLDAPHGAQLTRFVAQVGAGASWDDATATASGVIKHILVALGPAWHQGASARSSLLRLAGQARDTSSAEAATAAAQLGVRLVLPLGLCFLPAFALIGLLPLGLGLAAPL
ncbi:hypothetical protein GCM10010401_06350 [Rarobacter faecitabidus]|uniref:Type II secretion system (T2SS) protein F n=2 Tax=Rarobacter faecitabidus TaxID=13243 RepID=A0A542ZTD2_RARFA|nr:type II secretion system (T2SS) protein F [Rarobacter faecitabidus]